MARSKIALIGAGQHALGQSKQHSAITVQPMSLGYVRWSGLPVGRALDLVRACSSYFQLVHLAGQVRRIRRRKHPVGLH